MFDPVSWAGYCDIWCEYENMMIVVVVVVVVESTYFIFTFILI
jgi:hypothetical protein